MPVNAEQELKEGIYKHYKGQHYEVMGVGQHSETGEKLVFYRALYGDYGLWARPLEMFLESVEVDNQLVKRFCFIEADD
jgi:hypothetical protein